MADKFFYQPNGTDIEPYPFDGALGEYTAAELATAIGALTEVIVYDDDVEVTGAFKGLNFKSTTSMSSSVADSPLDAGDTVDISFTRAALTGDVTASANDNATTIANDAVTYAKMQNVSAASKLLGRGDSGSGDVQEITLGTNLSMSGTTLNASGGGGGSAAWIETEIDFGTTGVYDATFTITDASVSGTTEIAVVQSGNTATDRADGDSLWDSVIYAAKQAAGSFTLYAHAIPGPIVGKRKILYQVGT